MTDHNSPDDSAQQHAPLTPYQHTFDPETASVSAEVVRAVAVLTDSPSSELTILADVIDPEALNALFQHANNQARDSVGYVAFDYNGHQIKITTDGTITIISADEPSSSAPASEDNSEQDQA